MYVCVCACVLQMCVRVCICMCFEGGGVRVCVCVSLWRISITFARTGRELPTPLFHFQLSWVSLPARSTILSLQIQGMEYSDLKTLTVWNLQFEKFSSKGFQVYFFSHVECVSLGNEFRNSTKNFPYNTAFYTFAHKSPPPPSLYFTTSSVSNYMYSLRESHHTHSLQIKGPCRD